MTNEQRDIYMLLLMAGREDEALAFRDRCESENDEEVLLPNQLFISELVERKEN